MGLIDREEVILALLEKGQSSKRFKVGDTWQLNFEEIRECINAIPAKQERSNAVKIDISNGKNPYDAVVEEIIRRTNNYCDTYIVHLKTTNLGETKVIMSPDYIGYEFDTDWYEGGDVELLGFISVNDVDVPNNVQE